MDRMEAFIRGMPKTDLHMHLEGSLEPEVLIRLGERNKRRLRWKTAQELRAAYEFQDLQSFLDLYYEGCQVLVEEADFYEMTRAYLRAAHAENVIRAEVFLGPQSFTDKGVAIAAVLDSTLEAMDDARAEDGISCGLIVSAQRHRTEQDALDLLEQVRPWFGRILGIGMGGAEKESAVQVPPLLPGVPARGTADHDPCRRGGPGVLRARGRRIAGRRSRRSRRGLRR